MKSESSKRKYYLLSGQQVDSVEGYILTTLHNEINRLFSDYKVLHRVDGPAVEYPTGFKAYYMFGLKHRIDGPAVIHPQLGKEFYYLFGCKFTKKEYKNFLKNIKEVLTFNLLSPNATIRQIAELSIKHLNDRSASETINTTNK